MDFKLNAIIEDYAQKPFVTLPTHYRVHPVGYVESGYMTNVSAYLFPVRGEGYFMLDDQSFHFRPGMVIHGCPGKWLTSGNIADQPLEFYVMYYHCTAEDGGYLHRAFELETGINPTVLSLLKMLIKATERPDCFSRFQAKALMYSVLTEVFGAARSMKETGASSIVESTKQFMEFHYAQSHSLRDLAGRHGMCAKYFSEVFKKYTGITPIDYLIGYRMKQAYKFLLTTTCNVKEIAQSVGYQDAYYFSRLFKKQFGFSPSEVRVRSKAATDNCPSKW